MNKQPPGTEERKSVKLTELARLYHSNRKLFREVVCYLAVGVWNTFFGIGVYALLYAVFGGKVHYLLLTVPANILAVTNAYICYKLFVFRTKGNILREYFRCYLVYGTSMLLGMAGMYILVDFLHLNPVPANILLTCTTVAVSYLGHKFFSFRK